MNQRTGNAVSPIRIPRDFTPKNDRLREYFEALTTSDSVLEQQKILKDLVQHAGTTEDGGFVANLVCYLFLTIDGKHPLKKTISRVLLTMDEELVTSCMAVQILSLITGCEDAEKLAKLAKENDVLTNLNSCFGNFALGVEALSRIVNLVFLFACNNFIKSVAYLYLENGLDRQVLHSYIYGASKFLVSLLNQCDISHHISELSFKILFASYKVITDEHISFNTKANCGILLIMAAIHAPEVENKEGGALEALLRLQTEEGSSLLGNVTKNFSAKICIFSGILNTVPHEVICVDRLDDVPAPIYIFQSLLESASKRTGKPPEILEISRTFILLSRLLFNMDVDDIEVVFKPALEYVWTHIEHFIDTVRHDTIIVLRNFVKIAVEHEKNGHPKLIDYILEYISELLEDNSSNFRALQVISNETTCDFLLRRFPNLPGRLLAKLKNASIAQQVANAYEGLMEEHARESPNTWIDIWVKQLIPLIGHPDDGTAYAHYRKIFTSAFRIDPSTTLKILRQIASNRNDLPRYDLFTLKPQGHKIFSSPNELGLLLGCFVTARKANLSIGYYDDGDVETEELWNGMLEHKYLDILMCHQASEIRISILTLIVECHKTTEPFPSRDLTFLVDFLRYNIMSQMPNVRQQVTSLYKKAFNRLRDSLHAIRRNIRNLSAAPKDRRKQLEANVEMEKYYADFVRRIFKEVLVTGLYPDVNFPRRSLALELMLYLKGCVDDRLFAELWTRDCISALYKSLEDSYESNIVMSARLLLELPKEIVYYQDKQALKKDIQTCIAMAGSLKSTSTISAAYMLQVYKKSPLAAEVLQEILGPDNAKDDKDDVTVVLVRYLLEEIAKGLGVAEDNVLMASKYAPIYGLLFCVRHLVQKEHFEESFPEMVPEIIRLCWRISQVVSPIVNNSSPEGYVPCEGEEIVDETVTSQMILVYSWRTVKEISLLLGELSLKNHSGDHIVSPCHKTEIAQYFIKLFTETKHRGAYEQAYFGFSKFCSKLWSAGGVDAELPVKWLETILDVLAGKKDTFSKICPTRRSAGLPFIVQAVVSTEAPSRNHQSFHRCMETLLTVTESEDNENATTHCMNVLRTLYRHNQLGELVAPYIARGVMIAVVGFSHPIWGIRNSATMLFAALMTRIFGVQRASAGEEVSMKNRMSAKVFFMRYPELYNFLLEKLKTLSVDSNEGTSLYPLLLLLGRLYPSAEKSEMLQYLPYINACLASPVYRMRELAAQASIAAMPTDDHAHYIIETFKKLEPTLPANTLHGLLLQLQLLLKSFTKNVSAVPFSELVRDSFWIAKLAGENVTYTSAVLYLKMVIFITGRFKSGQNYTELAQWLAEMFKSSKHLNQAFESARLALHVHLHLHVLDLPTFCKETLIRDTVVAALSSPNEHLQLFALNCLKHIFQGCDDEDCSKLEHALVEPLGEGTKTMLAANIKRCELLVDVFGAFRVKNKEYILNFCGALRHFPCLVRRIRPRNVPVLLDPQVILDYLTYQCVTNDSDVFVAVLPLIDVLIRTSKESLDCSRIVHNVLKPFSTAESAPEERLAVSEFIVNHCRNLHDVQLLDLRDIVEVWYIVFDLLQDNDPAVRDSMARITNFMPVYDTPFTHRLNLGLYVTAEKALEESLSYLPLMVPRDEALSIYISLALKRKQFDEPSSTEVFDKGELNTYEEGSPLALAAARQLRKHIWELEDELAYNDHSIFPEEHAQLVATRLFNLLYAHHSEHVRSEDKLLSMLVLKEVVGNLESTAFRSRDYKAELRTVLAKKFNTVFSHNPNMFRYCRVDSFLRCVFDVDER